MVRGGRGVLVSGSHVIRGGEFEQVFSVSRESSVGVLHLAQETRGYMCHLKCQVGYQYSSENPYLCTEVTS